MGAATHVQNPWSYCSVRRDGGTRPSSLVLRAAMHAFAAMPNQSPRRMRVIRPRYVPGQVTPIPLLFRSNSLLL